MKKSILFLLVSFLFLNASSQLKVEKIASNFGIIWGMDFINKNKLILSQKDGKIFIYDLKTKKRKLIYQVKDVYNFGQGGLLDIKVSPSFSKDNSIYLTYAKTLNGSGSTTLAIAKYKNEKIRDFRDILVSKSLTNRNVHFGSRIAFDEKGHIFFTIGDRGIRKNSQNLTNHAGSIIRLNLNGSIPKDNPFVNNKNILPEIYSFGHRNPQGIFYDKDSKKLFSIEHGPRGGDEINLVEKGKNYGWPVISYGKEYWAPLSVGEGTSKKGMEQAIKYFVPSIAPSSLIVYKSDYLSSLKGSIISGALKLRHLNIIYIDEKNNVLKEKRLLKKLNERIRNVIETVNGNLILSTDSGNLYRVFK